MKQKTRIRRATKDDAAALAELVNMAGEGLPHYLWSKMAGEDEDAWDIGRARAMRDTGSFSYRNAHILEVGDEIAAALIGYPLDDEPEPSDYSSMPPMFVPLQELEDLAPGTWYINVIAAFPNFRGRGHGAELMSLAERLAAETGRRGLSLIVADANVGARRLYERCGYREAGTRPMIKEDWDSSASNWVLMIRDL